MSSIDNLCTSVNVKGVTLLDTVTNSLSLLFSFSLFTFAGLDETFEVGEGAGTAWLLLLLLACAVAASVLATVVAKLVGKSEVVVGKNT